jgi:hypothetical protein
VAAATGFSGISQSNAPKVVHKLRIGFYTRAIQNTAIPDTPGMAV